MMWRSIEFLSAHSMVFLAVLPFLILAYLFLERYRNLRLGQFGDSHVLSTILTKRSFTMFWLKTLLLSIALVCGVGALMQPRGNPHSSILLAKGEHKKEAVEQTRRRHDILFLVDVSASMGVADGAQTHQIRLDMAKELVDAIISQLRGENVALTAFTTEVLPIVPLTADYLFTRFMLRDLEINEGETYGTDIVKAIGSAPLVFNKTPSSVAKTLILISDGDNHLRMASERVEQLQTIREASGHLKEKGVHVIALGTGSLQGAIVQGLTYQGKPVESAQEPQVLERIASLDSYYDANVQSILGIAQKVVQEIEARSTILATEANTGSREASSSFIYDYYFQYPLGLALIALALFLVLPDTTKKIAMSNFKETGTNVGALLLLLFFVAPCVVSPFLEATDFENQARDAEVFFEAHDFERAIGIYESIIGQAPSLSQQIALEYNRANALLLEGKIDEAIGIYEKLSLTSTVPEISMRIAFNRALGTFMRAYKFERTFKDDKQTLDLLKDGFIEEAKSASDAAFKAQCFRDVKFGAKKCEKDPLVLALYALMGKWSAKDEQTKIENVEEQTQKIEKLFSQLDQQAEPATSKEVLIALIKAELALIKASRSLVLDSKLSTLENQERLGKAQEEIWQAAPRFIGAMRRAQMEQWMKGSLGSVEALWADVFALFNEGFLAAGNAKEALKEQIAKAIQLQSLAQEKWINALMLLKKLKESELKAPAKIKAPQPTQTTLMQQLQAMELDDKSTPHFIEGVNVPKVDMPW